MARGRRPPIAFATGSQNLHGRQRGFEATGSAVQGDREPVVKYAVEGDQEDKLARESHRRGTIRPRTDSVWYESDPAIWHPAVPHQV